jgi:hypothetical protein
LNRHRLLTFLKVGRASALSSSLLHLVLSDRRGVEFAHGTIYVLTQVGLCRAVTPSSSAYVAACLHRVLTKYVMFRAGMAVVAGKCRLGKYDIDMLPVFF